MASKQAIYQCLSQATQRHFSIFDVSLIDQFSVRDAQDDVVRVVLLGQGHGWISASAVKDCRRRFPRAAIGLVVEDGLHGVEQSIIEQRLVQGILPLTLPLDVWLAVMSLLISGGQYFGHETLGPGRVTSLGRDSEPEYHRSVPHPYYGQESPEPEGQVDNHHAVQGLDRPAHGANPAAAPGIDALTIRELQILQLVSQGLQNKLIANRMGLSEHTVKAHVHNLIAKLRVSNRTQAAASFLHGHETGQPNRGVSHGDASLVDLQRH